MELNEDILSRLARSVSSSEAKDEDEAVVSSALFPFPLLVVEDVHGSRFP
jgi:hypothetical protein